MLLGGCYLSHGPPRDGGPPPADAAPSSPDGGVSPRPVDDDAGVPLDAGFVAPDGGVTVALSCAHPLGVDLLLVLDDSGSIAPRDPQLEDRLGRMMQSLVTPPDLDRDGREDWPRVTDMHFGTVSTSVRAPGFCQETADGRLASRPAIGMRGCRTDYPSYLDYTEGDDPGTFAHDSVCVSFGPRDGCPIEQPLEAMAKALLPHDAPFTYIAGEPHGDTENAGFLRQDSVLVVVIVTDEDDCSVDSAQIIPGGEGTFEVTPSVLGCIATDKLHPLDRYAEVLHWLRPDAPERLLLGMIVSIDANTVVTHPNGTPPAACFGPMVFPQRLYGLAESFPARAVVGSLCGLAEMDGVHAIASRIGHAACGA